jgi:hypothetical protein
MTPLPDPVAALVFGATPADIDTVIIDGVVRKRSGRIVDFDVTTLKQRLCESAVRITEDASTVDHAQIEGLWAQIFPRAFFERNESRGIPKSPIF